MTATKTIDLLALAERLEKRSKEEREIVANSTIVAQLLQPELDRFEARAAANLYAVRMAVDHRNSAKKDAAFADDLEAAIAALRAMEASNGQSDRQTEAGQ